MKSKEAAGIISTILITTEHKTDNHISFILGGNLVSVHRKH